MQDVITRYPLTWPAGWPRTRAGDRRPARFGTRGPKSGALRGLTLLEAQGRLTGELRRLKAESVLLSTNVKLTTYGVPYSRHLPPHDPGVAAYFHLEGADRCLACDAWSTVAGNVGAVAAHVFALRAVTRYCVGSTSQAFAGYQALPPTEADWAIVLGVAPGAGRADVEAAYRDLAARHHPDLGGDPAQMVRINLARDRALEDLAGA